jgi:peptidoglycan/LPS O-acetylase OafA/YrhL
MLGSLACQASERIKDKKPIIGYAALLVSIASMLLGSRSGFDSFRLYLSVICFAISLPAVFATTKSIAVLNFLGDLSYPLYLVQILVFVLVGHGIMEWCLIDRAEQLAYTSLLLFLCSCFAAAAICHYLLERPIAWVMKSATSMIRFNFALSLARRAKLLLARRNIS